MDFIREEVVNHKIEFTLQDKEGEYILPHSVVAIHYNHFNSPYLAIGTYEDIVVKYDRLYVKLSNVLIHRIVTKNGVREIENLCGTGEYDIKDEEITSIETYEYIY